MAKTVRQYSQKTLKLLFGSCGNQCAEPSCTNPIIAAASGYSEAAVIGQICHIYAAADNGPRGKPGLTEKERNLPSNLILLCGHHHPIVDKQWETYPAKMLIDWKKEHEAKYEKETAEAVQRQAEMQRHAFYVSVSDRQINVEVERIRKGRFLAGFPTEEAARALAAQVDKLELAGGSTAVRAQALAWCSRLLATGDSVTYAQELLGKAKTLASGEGVTIAEAFLMALRDRDRALITLAALDSPAARSAALFIVSNHGDKNGGVPWFEQTGWALGDLDSDGKLKLLLLALQSNDWDRAIRLSAEITEDDFRDTPTLLHAVATAELIQAAPRELCSSLLTQVPFFPGSFPLADGTTALDKRRRAAELFRRVSNFARSMGCADAANVASDFALWLKLRDPHDNAEGMDELRASMRNPVHSLRRLNLAIRFGIKLDLAAIEHLIEQRIAISGNGTSEEAFARFSLAFTQDNPRAAAEYIARHRTQLYEHLQKTLVQTIEIELLAKGGLLDQANQRLAKAIADGLGVREEESLRQIIDEAGSDDPVTARRQVYEQTDDLHDLVHLIHLLEDRKAWQEMLPYAEKLFARTGTAEDAVRIGTALAALRDYRKLSGFLADHPDLIDRSERLRGIWAWALYREGHFDEASNVLRVLTARRDNVNDRALRVNLAIDSGNWVELIAYTTSEWEAREQRSPAELITAGQLAQAVGAPHARDLITDAAKRAPNDPAILAAAYFHATSAGWEKNETTSQWLNRAAMISGEDGPLKSMSLKELFERKPEWDKQESSAAQQLNAGRLPMFGAAHMLHRSLLDLMLLTSLANMSEPDPRRRCIIYAYSGARPGYVVPKPERIALDLSAIVTLARLDLLDTVLGTYADVVIPNSTLGWLFQERQRARFHQPSRIRDAHLVKRLIAAKALQVLAPLATRDHALDQEVGTSLADLLTAVRIRMASDPSTPRYVIRSAPVHRVGSIMEERADLKRYTNILCSCQAVLTKLCAKGVLTSGEVEVARSYLKLHEKCWPSEPAIADNAELFLDDLSVDYLRTVGVLDKLHAAGLKVFIHESEDSEANRLIDFEVLADGQLEIIEAIRQTVAGGLTSGRVHAAGTREAEEHEDIRAHPTFAVLGMGDHVDALVIDDRFVNQHATMTDENVQTPIITTQELLQDLADRGALAPAAVLAHRTTLRRAGYQLIPVTEEELFFHLDNAKVKDGRLLETAELRAIRESLLRARMSKMLQIPLEVPWLQRSMAAVVGVIRGLLCTGRSVDQVRACSNWLLQLLDIRGFAASAVPGTERNFALYAYAAQLLQLVPSMNEMPSNVRARYDTWLNEAVLENIRATQPEVFTWLTDQCRALVSHASQAAAATLER